MKEPLSKAQIPNPALKAFGRLVGEWKTTGTHPERPGVVLNGTSSFAWIEGGAFLAWHSAIDEKDFPAGVALFGSDDALEQFHMLYFDERKVSRKYDVTIEKNVLTWSRNEPGFAQRCTWTFSANGKTFISKGELRQGRKAWKPDLEQTFTRVK